MKRKSLITVFLLLVLLAGFSGCADHSNETVIEPPVENTAENTQTNSGN